LRYDQPADAAGHDRRGAEDAENGTRLPVELILRYLDSGQADGDVLEAFPGLTLEDCPSRPVLGGQCRQRCSDPVVLGPDPRTHALSPGRLPHIGLLAAV